MSCLLEYCISGTGTNYDGGYYSAGTYNGFGYYTGSTYTIYYSTGQTQWCLATSLGNPTCLLFGKSPCVDTCPDLCDEIFGPGPCPSPTPTPTAACSIDFDAIFDCEVTPTPTVTPTVTPTITPTPTPSSSNPCGGVAISVSGITYTPTPTPTPTVTPSSSPDVTRPCNYTGLVIFNTLDDYIRCANSKQFKDCTSGFVYSSSDVVLSPSGGIPTVGYVYSATINGDNICVTYIGVAENISGSDVITLNIEHGTDCSICSPIPSPTPTPTSTLTPTPTPSSTPAVCCEYTVTNLLFTANTFSIVNCSDNTPEVIHINGGSTIIVKSTIVPYGININVVFNDCPCTSPILFSGTTYWGEDGPTACGESIPITNCTGDNTTFCNSNTFYSDDFIGIGTGYLYLSYGGQVKIVNHTSGDNFVTFNSECTSCFTTLQYNLGEFGTMYYPAVSMYCDGSQVGYGYVSNYGPYVDIDTIVDSLNTYPNTNQFGTFSNLGGGYIQLIVPLSVFSVLCPSGVLSFSVQSD